MLCCQMPDLVTKKLIEQALFEDIGSGDITTEGILKQGQSLKAVINSRAEGIISGITVAENVFKILDPEITFKTLVNDGQEIKRGQNLAIIEGNPAAILSGERTALNFLQRMSAISTLTNKYQHAIHTYKAKVTDTRKTTPNFRIFEKYAVKAGGGSPHRFGLFDAVMIKDNHIKLAGSITEAVKLIRNNLSHTTKIEIETETLDEVNEALNCHADILMLDNMSVKMMKEAVALINGRAITEASGNISLENINQVASTGVDYISTRAITAKAGIIDIGLDI